MVYISICPTDLAAGGSIDWVYATRNVDLTFAFEFRDKGKSTNTIHLQLCH